MSYVSNIASSIQSHSGNPALLGPEVYTAIAEWEKHEIPREVVLNSIEEVYTETALGDRDHITVEAFQDAVFKNFTIWLAAKGNRESAAA